jgi:hypothetical protein
VMRRSLEFTDGACHEEVKGRNAPETIEGGDQETLNRQSPAEPSLVLATLSRRGRVLFRG